MNANPFTIYTPVERTIVLDEYSLLNQEPEAQTTQPGTVSEPEAPETETTETVENSMPETINVEIGLIDAWYRKNLVLISFAQWFLIIVLIFQLIKLKK